MIYPVDAASGQTPEASAAFYQSSYASMPKIRLVRVDNSRHLIMLDQPDRFMNALTEALK